MTSVKEFAQWLGYFQVALSWSLSLFFFVRVRTGLDRAMIIIVIAYDLTFLMDITSGIDWIDIVSPTNGALIWALLYFFVFEMIRLRDKLESDSF